MTDPLERYDDGGWDAYSLFNEYHCGHRAAFRVEEPNDLKLVEFVTIYKDEDPITSTYWAPKNPDGFAVWLRAAHHLDTVLSYKDA